MTLTVIILTRDEELHIERAIASVADIADRVVVVDSHSTDTTVERARAAGAEVLVHDFVTQAKQFNWALDQLPGDTEWILRLDADEIVDPRLSHEIATNLISLGDEVAGVEVSRRIAFMGKPIRFGGVSPIRLIRLFRFGRGRSEDRWMDEHILVDGRIVSFRGEILDHNLKPLDWWVEKHNQYASREAIELLNAEYNVLGHNKQNYRKGQHTSLKRWIKERIYVRLPGGSRALAYFLYRYIFRFGFLDGSEGFAFHVLQGFWYRYLVDMKLRDVRNYMRNTKKDVVAAINDRLGIQIDRPQHGDE